MSETWARTNVEKEKDETHAEFPTNLVATARTTQTWTCSAFSSSVEHERDQIQQRLGDILSAGMVTH